MKASKMITVLAALFAATASATVPNGWFVAGSQPKNYDFDIDSSVAAEGRRSATITSRDTVTKGDISGFGTLMQIIAADDYRGSRVRLTAAMKTKDADRGQLWMRVDGRDKQSLAFDNMDDRPVSGTQDWARYSIVLDVPADATKLNYGVFLMGTGKVWFDDFKLEKVPTSVPLTSQSFNRKPMNLGFEEP